MDIDELVVGIEGKEIVRVVSVKPLVNYTLKIKLSNGRSGIFDVSKFVGKGVFKKLKDPEYFRRVSLSRGTITWPDEQDIDPELIEMELQPESGSSR